MASWRHGVMASWREEFPAACISKTVQEAAWIFSRREQGRGRPWLMGPVKPAPAANRRFHGQTPRGPVVSALRWRSVRREPGTQELLMRGSGSNLGVLAFSNRPPVIRRSPALGASLAVPPPTRCPSTASSATPIPAGSTSHRSTPCPAHAHPLRSHAGTQPAETGRVVDRKILLVVERGVFGWCWVGGGYSPNHDKVRRLTK